MRSLVVSSVVLRNSQETIGTRMRSAGGRGVIKQWSRFKLQFRRLPCSRSECYISCRARLLYFRVHTHRNERTKHNKVRRETHQFTQTCLFRDNPPLPPPRFPNTSTLQPINMGVSTSSKSSLVFCQQFILVAVYWI